MRQPFRSLLVAGWCAIDVGIVCSRLVRHLNGSVERGAVGRRIRLAGLQRCGLVGGRPTAEIDVSGGQVADLAQHVVQLIGGTRPPTRCQALQLQLDIGKHLGIEQIAQLFGTEEVPQQIAVERQRRCASLGKRSIALVHVRGDPVEQQAGRHRAGLAGIDADDTHLARAQITEHFAQRRHVKDVLETLPGRLEQDGERRELGGDGQEVGCLLTLLPQRCALVGSAPRKQ